MNSKIYNLVKGSIGTENKARLVSDLLNPLIMPPLAIGVLACSTPMATDRILLLFGITLLFYTVLPLISAVLLSQKMGSDNLDFTLKSSRKVLYGISVISAFVGVLLVFEFFSQYYLRLTAVIFLTNLIAALLLNSGWKLSVHSAAVTTAGVCLLIFSRFNPEALFASAAGILLLFVFLPLVSWSRYRLNVHSVSELLGGITVGLVLTVITALLWTYF